MHQETWIIMCVSIPMACVWFHKEQDISDDDGLRPSIITKDWRSHEPITSIPRAQADSQAVKVSDQRVTNPASL